MSEALLRPDLREVMQRLASELPRTQRVLDAVYLDGLAHFAPVLAAARRAGLEGIARPLAPQRQLAGEYSASVRFHVAESADERREIRVSVLNAGYLARHSAARFAMSRIRVRVRQAAFSPGTEFDQ